MNTPSTILLVEDNPTDVFLIRQSFDNLQIEIEIDAVNNGIDALKYLKHELPFTDKKLPDMILLDINLPGINGREILGTIKNDDMLKTIPVVMLTSSKAMEDITQSYQLGANSYIAKPFDLDSLDMAIQAIENFWFKTVILPGNYC